VIPRGVIYLLEFQQKAGNLRADLRFTGDGSEAAQADCVVFQCMQSDYTDLCWELVNGGDKPLHAVVADGTPMLLIYDRAAVASALARLETKHVTPNASTTPHVSSDTKRPTR